MVILRATQKVLKRLPLASADDVESDTALGDWYVNRLVVDRKHLLLLVSSKSLLPILTPARGLRNLPGNLPGLVFDRIKRLDIDLELIGSEMDAMSAVSVGPTSDRSVLGTLVEFGLTVQYYAPLGEHDSWTLRRMEDRLSETPCRVTRRATDTIFPTERAIQLLEEKWGRARGIVH